MQQFKDITLNTFYLYKETLAEGERQYQQGQIDQLNSLISELVQQQREGYKFAQIFKMLKEQNVNNEFTARILENNFDINKKTSW